MPDSVLNSRLINFDSESRQANSEIVSNYEPYGDIFSQKGEVISQKALDDDHLESTYPLGEISEMIEV